MSILSLEVVKPQLVPWLGRFRLMGDEELSIVPTRIDYNQAWRHGIICGVVNFR